MLPFSAISLSSELAGPPPVNRSVADTLDTLPLQSVAEPVPEVLSQFFDEKWEQGKLSELWTEEDEAALLQLLSPYLDAR